MSSMLMVQRPSTSTNSHASRGFKIGVTFSGTPKIAFRFRKIVAIVNSLPDQTPFSLEVGERESHGRAAVKAGAEASRSKSRL